MLIIDPEKTILSNKPIIHTKVQLRLNATKHYLKTNLTKENKLNAIAMFASHSTICGVVKLVSGFA